MARTKSQKAKRSRNRSTFDLMARKTGAVKTVRFFYRHDIRGVNQAQYLRVCREWFKRTAVEYANTPSADGSGKESIVHDLGIGAVRLNEKVRQGNRTTKAPLTHVRVSTQAERKLRGARRHYRKVKAGSGLSGKQVDAVFKRKFPSQWRLLASDEHR